MGYPESSSPWGREHLSGEMGKARHFSKVDMTVSVVYNKMFQTTNHQGNGDSSPHSKYHLPAARVSVISRWLGRLERVYREGDPWTLRVGMDNRTVIVGKWHGDSSKD